VIGFGLAQVAWNLTFPAHAKAVFTHPLGLIAYFVTFGIVSLIWVAHHRLFAHYFVRSPLFVFLNFVLLAFTVLLVYMLQIFMRFGVEGNDPWGAYGYFGCAIVVYGLLSILFVLGIRARWAELTAEQRRKGIFAAVRTGGVSVGTLIGWALTSYFGIAIFWAPFAIFPITLATRVAFRIFSPRIS
jgi:uncharacterized membrane protein